MLLFGIPEEKDDEGSGAWDDDGIVQRALRALRAERARARCSLTDVCLCEYTRARPLRRRSRRRGRERRDARAARAHGRQPRRGRRRRRLPERHDGRPRRRDPRGARRETPIVAYAAKYASAFYGPFREVAESAPAFGDRRGYQMDPANVREALRECELDLAEGADVLMVKPALPYLDVIRAVRERFDCPVAAYNVSGEYAMVKAAAAAGHLDERAAALEALTAIKRAGADVVVTYWAKDARARGSEARSPSSGARATAADPRRRQLAGARDAGGRARRAALHARAARAPYIEDVDGNRYVDWVHVLGAARSSATPIPRRSRRSPRRPRAGRRSARRPRREVELAAEIVDAVPSVEMVRLVSSGTEAAMSAIRLARGVHAPRPDPQVRRLLPRPRRRAARERRAPGSRRSGSRRRRACPRGVAGRHDRLPPTTTSTRAAAAVERYGEGLAAILVEPVAGNMGVVPPAPGLPRGAARALRRVAARCSSSTR